MKRGEKARREVAINCSPGRLWRLLLFWERYT
nr:MAG TPA: hypothetical protein [Caudoviricetes sp.]